MKIPDVRTAYAKCCDVILSCERFSQDRGAEHMISNFAKMFPKEHDRYRELLLLNMKHSYTLEL
jgi:hypothetical protein